MPVISFDKKYLFELLGSGMDEEKLRDQVMKLGFEIESVDEKSISLEVTANRLDLLDAVGFARAVRNFMHRSKKYVYSIPGGKPALEIAVDRNIRKVRPFISAIVAENLKLDQEMLANLINFTEKFCETYGRNRRKVAIGLHNLDMIKPPIVYGCEEDIEYVPLGGNEKMTLSKVLKEHQKGAQYSEILKKRRGAVYPVIKDSGGVAAFVPILNSERTKVTTDTRNIFVDITGTSEYAVNKAADLIAASLIDLGANVKRVMIRYDKEQIATPEMETRYINIPLIRAEREIGVRIGFNNVISIANKMGYEAALVGNSIRFRIPEYRLDIIGVQDVIEDIAIGYGYDYIMPSPIYYAQEGGLEGITELDRKTAELMIGLGFSEFTNTYLSNESTNFGKMNIENDKSAIILKNSKTETITMLRTWVLPSILNNIGASAHERMPQEGFEIDLAYKVRDGNAVESCHLGAVSINPKSNFNDIKAMVEGLLTALGLSYEIAGHKHTSFIDGRCAEITVNGKGVGFFGELHPKVLKNFGIEEAGTAVEINITALLPKS